MPSPPAECPRCGYDLSGLVAAWTASCPLRATCAECGIDFECGNVLSARCLGPAWSFEHGVRRSWGRWRATSRASLNPWRLTRELRIDHQVRPRRLLAFAAVWIGAGWVLLGVGRFVFQYGPGPWTAPPPGYTGQSLWLEWDCWAPRLGALLWPYGHMPIAAVFGVPIGFPLYVPLIAFALPWAMMPLLMCILGETFQRASVRRAHLLRGAAYSLPGMSLKLHTVICMVIGSMIAQSLGATLDVAAPLVILGLAGVSLLWLATWWWLFISRYLRLRHGAAVALLLMFTSCLAAATFLAVLAVLNGPG
jgi:hypothetical protein